MSENALERGLLRIVEAVELDTRTPAAIRRIVREVEQEVGAAAKEQQELEAKARRYDGLKSMALGLGGLEAFVAINQLDYVRADQFDACIDALLAEAKR